MIGQDLAMIAFGIMLCFAGYSMFHSMLPAWGFLLMGWVFYVLLPVVIRDPRADQLLFQIAAFVIGGIIGALISKPLYYAIVFMAGAALGMLIGILVGAVIDVGGIASVPQLTTFTRMSFPPLPQTATQFILMVIFGLILGGVGIGFQKFMICASSAFLGSVAIITGLGGSITMLSSTDVGRGAIMLTGMIVLGVAGLFLQFRMLGEV